MLRTLKTYKKKVLDFWPYLLLAGLLILVYLPTFSGEFMLDDHSLIKNNPYAKSLQSPLSYLIQEDGITDECDMHIYHTGYYRPLLNLTYLLDHKLWGSSATGFRVTNLILHLFCCFILFRFLQFMVNDRHAALWATLIFAIHSANTEAVSWIISRNNILVTMLSISSLFLYITGREGGNRLNLMASVLTFALAILCKEVGLMVVPLFFLYQRLLSRTRRNVRDELLGYVPFIIVIVAYLLMRKAVTASFLSPVEMIGFWNRVYFAPYVILWNLKLIFLPYGLHSFVVDYPSTYLNWQSLAGFCYAGFLGIFIWKQWKNRLILFSVLSFHVALFPTLNIFPTSAISLVSMRWMYFPMAFLSLAAAQTIKGFLKKGRFVRWGILWPILAYLGSYSYILNNSLWHNEGTLFRQEVLNFDNYYYAGDLAQKLFHENKYRDAENYFQIAMDHYPGNVMNYLNYSALLIKASRPDAALACLKEARSLPMTSNRMGQWFNNMGAAHFNLGNRSESAKYFLKATKICPNKTQYQVNLGSAYLVKGDYAKALAVLQESLKFTPDSAPLRKNLALAYINMGKDREAVRALERIPEEKWDQYGVRDLIKNAEAGRVVVNPATDRSHTPKTP
jgi:protein O-mannosyl-transferase